MVPVDVINFDTNYENSEIGTGFYVEKKPSDTNDFLDRKLKIVDANSENITMAVQATRYVKYTRYSVQQLSWFLIVMTA